MIDDFSVSGVNDGCSIHSKISLHMIDTLGAVTRRYFGLCKELEVDSKLVARTFDLKSAYRQIAVCKEHLKYAYFSVYNCEVGAAEIYQLLTSPFGATHSVYSFLRLAKMIHFAACKALHWINTNFYDDFVLLSKPGCSASAGNSMELLLMLLGWEYAKEGKKATQFASVCKALGVEFDFSRSEQRLLTICNTEQRKTDLIVRISEILEAGTSSKHDALVGRLGRLVLKRVVEHAYLRNKVLSTETIRALLAMKTRLEAGQPMSVSDRDIPEWFVYTDAAYEQGTKTGGLGAVLVDQHGTCFEWFGVQLEESACVAFGSAEKDTIIYELELAAAVLALSYWKVYLSESLVTWFGDNDSVRFALIKASATGRWAEALLQFHLEEEVKLNTRAWFSRVPTEANLSDYPSRQCAHLLLKEESDRSMLARVAFKDLISYVTRFGDALISKGGGSKRDVPLAGKKRALSLSSHQPR